VSPPTPAIVKPRPYDRFWFNVCWQIQIDIQAGSALVESALIISLANQKYNQKLSCSTCVVGWTRQKNRNLPIRMIGRDGIGQILSQKVPIP
jgi:hypothetical protein